VTAVEDRPTAVAPTLTDDAPAPNRSLRRRQRLAGLAFLAPALLFVIVFFGYPLVYNVVMSVRDYTVSSFYDGGAAFTGWTNYRLVFTDPEFSSALWHTAVFTVVSLVFQFGIGLALAVFFAKHFPLSGLIRALLLLPWLLPLVVSGSIWRWMLDQNNGVVNAVLSALQVTDGSTPWLTSPGWSLASVIIGNIWIGIPFNLVLLYGGIQAIPESLYEASALDGAGAWRRFRYITWPLLRPVTAVTLMLGLIYTIKVFDVIAVMTGGGPAGSTTTLTVLSYDKSFQDFMFGQGAAVGNVLIVIAMIFGLVYLRSIRSTMSGGTS
jgi:multiple sugar transport system permease protein